MRLIQEGPRDAKIVIVAEAPGKKEEEQGRPFVGGAGDLLNKILNAVRLMRSEIFISNVCHTRPPKNDFNWFLRPNIRPEYIRGVVQLKEDLEAIRPNVVVALGAQALRALTNITSIGKWRGSILESTLVPGLKVIGTYHPAFVFKGKDGSNYPYKAVIEFDMRRAAEESKFREIKLPQRRILIDPENKQRVAAEMCEAEWLAIDIECFETDTGWKLACVGFSDEADRALVLPWDNHENQLLIRMLCESKAKKILQNGFNFDVPVLANHGVVVKNYKWDTMVGMHVIYIECASSEEETQMLTGRKKTGQPALRKGLAFQTSIFTKERYYKDDGKLWQAAGDLNLFWTYNGKDCCVQREIQTKQATDIKEMGAGPTMEREMSMLPCLMDMTERGIPIDVKTHAELREKIVAEIMNLQGFLDKGAGQSINVKSPKDVPWLLFDKLSLPILKRSVKTDRPSANKDVINALAEKYPDNPLLMCILEIRERRDLIERYLDVAYDDDKRMRCAWDPTGTRTGRLASRVSVHGTGTNLQNQPESLRRMYVPDSGKVMWSIDYSQAEARVVAWLARCEALIELFLDPTRDVHKENAARFYKIAVEVVTFLQRYVAKRVIHASNYGLGYNKLMRVINNDYRDTGIRITLDEARLGQELYFGLYPEIKENYWKDVRNQLARDLTLVNAFGRMRMFFGQWNDRFLNEAYSYYPQSSVGDLTNQAMVRVYNEVPDADLFINGHDSLVGQCEPDNLADVAARVQECMRIPMVIHGRELVIPTDVEVGYNWGKKSDDNPQGLRPLEEWLTKS